MGDPKKFEKYKRYGAYHWGWYGKKKNYTDHVNFLKEWIREKNTIDIGAGDGLITSILEIYGIDNDPYGIKAAKEKGVKIDLGDAYNLPYKDNQFESALMSDTIEHFSDYKRALKETRRVINKFFYVNIPANERFIEPDHYHAWTAEEFVKEVENIGFKIVEKPIPELSRNMIYFKFEKV